MGTPSLFAFMILFCEISWHTHVPRKIRTADSILWLFCAFATSGSCPRPPPTPPIYCCASWQGPVRGRQKEKRSPARHLRGSLTHSFSRYLWRYTKRWHPCQSVQLSGCSPLIKREHVILGASFDYMSPSPTTEPPLYSSRLSKAFGLPASDCQHADPPPSGHKRNRRYCPAT